jgi:hypothetical protein
MISCETKMPNLCEGRNYAAGIVGCCMIYDVAEKKQLARGHCLNNSSVEWCFGNKGA